MLLETTERYRFAEYCRRQSESSKAIAEQMEKHHVPAIGQIAKVERQKATAYAIVAIDLMAYREEFSAGPEDISELQQEDRHE